MTSVRDPASATSVGGAGGPAMGGSTRLVLVRHGESYANVEGIFAGPLLCKGLSPLGVAQVEALRDRLIATGEIPDGEAPDGEAPDGEAPDGEAPDGEAPVLFSSDIPRAKETAQLLAPALGDADAVVDPAWAELDAGEAEGMTWDQLCETFGMPDLERYPDRAIAPGGESWVGLRARVSAAIDRVGRKYAGRTIVVATHAGAIEAAVLDALGLADHATRIGLRAENASLTECAHAAGSRRLRLVTFNDAAHLRRFVPAR